MTEQTYYRWFGNGSTGSVSIGEVSNEKARKASSMDRCYPRGGARGEHHLHDWLAAFYRAAGARADGAQVRKHAGTPGTRRHIWSRT